LTTLIQRAALGAVLAGFATSAYAQDIDDGWRVSVTPYLWASSFEGDVGTPPTGRTHKVKLSFSDIVDHLSIGLLGKTEVQRGRTGAILDFIYLKLSADTVIDPRNLPDIGAEVDVTTTIATLAGFYRVYRSERLDVDLVAGARFNKAKLDLNLQGAGPGVDRTASRSWTDPIVGVRAAQRVGDKVWLTGYADTALIGAVSDSNWQVQATVNYQWKPGLTLLAGYRYYEVDYDKDLFSYDTVTQGPIIGATHRF
jgi:hypothetical protein